MIITIGEKLERKDLAYLNRLRRYRFNVLTHYSFPYYQQYNEILKECLDIIDEYEAAIRQRRI